MRAIGGLILMALGMLAIGDNLESTRVGAVAGEYRAVAPGLSGDSVPAAGSGTITIAAQPFLNWDPHDTDQAVDIAHVYKVWRGLYELGQDQTPRASMAAGMPSVSPDGRVYTIKLKPGLLWSDGDQLDAHDFVAGIQRTCNPSIASSYQYVLSNVVGCDEYRAATAASPSQREALRQAIGARAIDGSTIEIELQEPQVSMVSVLAMWPTFPVPTHVVSNVEGAWPGPMANVYNGPFKPSEFVANDRLELVANPYWAGQQKPRVARIVVRYINDTAVAAAAYRAGAVDATVADSGQLDLFKVEFPVQLALYPGMRTIGLQFNVEAGPLQDPRVRLALSRATDRELLNAVVWASTNFATTSWVPSERNGLQGGEYDDILGFNVAAAQDLLEAAGYAGGNGWPGLVITLTDSASNRALGAFLEAQWNKHLGIEVTLEFVGSEERADRFNTSDFQVMAGGWQEDYPDPENWFLGQWETGGTLNHTNTSVQALDALLALARHNTNEAQRRQQYREAEAILLMEANGIAPLWHTQAKFLVKPHISGMVENKRGSDTFVPGDWSPEYWGTMKQ